MKRIFTPQRKQPSTVLFPVLMEKHIEDEKLRSSVTDLQIFVAVDEVTGLNFANVADVNSDAFPEAGVIRHVEPPSVRRCRNRQDIPGEGSAPTGGSQ